MNILISKVWHQVIARNFFLYILSPLIRIFSQLRIPHKCILTVREKANLYNATEGAIVLTRTKWCLSNLLIPGKFWTHCAIVTGAQGIVFEASPKKGVIEKTFNEFIYDKDYLKVLYAPNINPDVWEEIFLDALQVNGTPYDWFFRPNFKAFYCAEFVAYLLNMRVPQIITPKIVMGIETILPAHFNDSKNFIEFNSER